MKTLFKFIYLTLLSIAPICLNAQVHVIAPNGHTGIGTDTPTEKLEVEGNVKVNGTKLQVGANATGVVTMELGEGRATDGSVSMDLVSDKSLYPNYGCRFNRDGGGTSRFTHRGAKPLWFLGQDAGSTIKFATEFTTRMVILQDGRVGIGTNTPNAGTKLHVNGTAVKPGGGDWGMASDKRLKKNIKNFDLGLKEVLSINPVRYQYNGKAGITDSETEYVGIIAQDFQKVAPYAIGEYTYTEVVEHLERETYSEEVGETETYLSVDASSIRYMLVNAVKEQQRMIESLQKEIREMKNGKEATFNHKAKTDFTDTNLGEQAILKQNAPNPFSKTTTIEYYLPATTRSASIKVFNLVGKELKSERLQATGANNIELNLSELPKGMYLYSLIVDGNIVDSKQMIVE